MVILDIETYRDYFLVTFKSLQHNKIAQFELYENNPLNIQAIKSIMDKNTTVSFNGLSYDLPVIALALKGANNEKLKAFSDAIIKSNLPSWRICKDFNVYVPKQWDHIDLIEIAPGQASLKIYGGRLNAPKLQDLPIEPDASITPDLRELMRTYCVNDIETTELLLNKLLPQIELRKAMSEQYGLDLRSKSDAQIAETIIKSELTALTGNEYRPERMNENTVIHYRDPEFIEYQSEQLQSIFKRILETEFTLGLNGSVVMPDWLKDTKIQIGNGFYQMGIGGLHSCEKSQVVTANNNQFLIDCDVASYYPSIILQQKLAPKSMGKDFIELYQSIVTRRLNAKHRCAEIGKQLKIIDSEMEKDALLKELSSQTINMNTLKLSINGSFGKLGSKYSALYAPELLIQTTITGQLALLMLIEKLELTGIRVVSANTDGIVVYGDKSLLRELEVITWDWMLLTSYQLEETHYKTIASRDVNNYIAVKTDGKIKRKGCFAESGLSKNPEFIIIYDAVCNYVGKNIPIEETITNCTDITKFLAVRRVTGGALWRDEYLGKAVRFYYSSDVDSDECIRYAKNSNKVPKSNGAKPLMVLPEKFPSDVNFKVYINEANDLLKDIGYA